MNKKEVIMNKEQQRQHDYALMVGKKFEESSKALRPRKVIVTPERRNVSVIWKDNTSTTVNAHNGDTFDPNVGFAVAFTRKVFGTSDLSKSGFKVIENQVKRKNSKGLDESKIIPIIAAPILSKTILGLLPGVYMISGQRGHGTSLFTQEILDTNNTCNIEGLNLEETLQQVFEESNKHDVIFINDLDTGDFSDANVSFGEQLYSIAYASGTSVIVTTKLDENMEYINRGDKELKEVCNVSMNICKHSEKEFILSFTKNRYGSDRKEILFEFGFNNGVRYLAEKGEINNEE